MRRRRYLERELGLSVSPVDPQGHVGEIISRLKEIDERWSDVRSTSRDLLDSFEESGHHSGKSPVGLAAAAIYLACQIHHRSVTQEEISEVADASTVTIRHRYQEIESVAYDH